VAEALLLARRTGVDLDALVAVMKAGSGGSAMLELKQRPIREHDYATLFKLAHMLKDVRLCLAQAREAEAPFEFGEATERILARAEAEGHGDEDFAALAEVLERGGAT
jgi:3-hydroxyisobutyrate dehydrogenase-like beta-hydroxyacid dehydrogenase